MMMRGRPSRARRDRRIARSISHRPAPASAPAPAPASALFALLALLGGALLAACGDPPVLALTILTPDEPDPLVGVSQVRLVVSSPAAEHTVTVTDPRRFELELEIEAQSAVGTITLEGLAGSSLVARGETPPMILRPVEEEQSLLVARAGALSRLKPRLNGAGREQATLLLPGSGVLLAGGLDAGGKPTSAVALYDFFDHELRTLASLPAPRAGAVGGICGSSCALVATGNDAKGLATKIQRYESGVWSEHDDGLAPGHRRKNASAALLADGTYLVVGGEGLTGALDSVLILDPDDGTGDPSLRALATRAYAARLRPALAVTTGAVLIAGGQQSTSDPVAELFYTASSTFQRLTVPGPTLAGGAAAVDLGDNRVAIVGGRDAAGKPLRDAWIVDPATLKVTHLPGVLKEGRTGHRALRLGAQVVVVGGATETGLAGQAEVLATKDLTNLRQVPMRVPREGCSATHLGQGSLLVAGGTPTAGGTSATNVLEIYETAVPLPAID